MFGTYSSSDMLFSILLLAVSLQASLARPQARESPTLADYTQAFSAAQIVPDVLASFNPTAFLDVVYTDPVTKDPLSTPPGIRLMVERECHIYPLSNAME